LGGKSASVDLAGGFSDLKMTWLVYCAGAAIAVNKHLKVNQENFFSHQLAALATTHD